MKHLKKFKTREEALNKDFDTPLVAIIAGLRKVCFASKKKFGESVTIVEKDDDFIQGLGGIPVLFKTDSHYYPTEIDFESLYIFDGIYEYNDEIYYKWKYYTRDINTCDIPQKYILTKDKNISIQYESNVPILINPDGFIVNDEFSDDYDDNQKIISVGILEKFDNEWIVRTSMMQDGIIKPINLLVQANIKHQESYVVPENIDMLMSGLFTNDHDIVEITLPNNIIISDSCFKNCYSLETINNIENCIEIKLGVIPNLGAFGNCDSINDITLNNIVNIGSYAFVNSGLMNINITSHNITYIAPCVFYNCSNLTNVYLPNSITEIGYNAFRNCSDIDIYYEGTKEEWNNINIDSDAFELTNVTMHFNSIKNNEKATLLYGTESYGEYPFIDIDEYYEYVGEENINGITYYKWQKIGDEYPRGNIYILTTTRKFSNDLMLNPEEITSFIFNDEFTDDYKSFTLMYAGNEAPTKLIEVPHHNTSSLNANGFDYVDLGLPSGALWATMNVGANSETEYGGYYAWGETSEKTEYNRNNYKYSDGSNFSKYNENDGLKILLLSDDAAHVNMGGDWHIPTLLLFGELLAYTNNEWVENYKGSGVNGRLFTSKFNGNTLFFPAAGYKWSTLLYNTNTYLNSSTLYSYDINRNCQLHFNSGETILCNDMRLLGGCVVRGVLY